MAKDKKSFILYCDITTTIHQLPDETAGKLFKHLLDYVNDKHPESDDLLLNIAFEPIKQSLKRDLKKFEVRQETARINGLRGGRPKNLKKAKEPSGLIGLKNKPRKPVSVSVSVSDKERLNMDSLEEFIDHRKDIKTPLTELALKKVCNKLKHHHKDEQKSIIDRSIENGWKGIFPPEVTKEQELPYYE